MRHRILSMVPSLLTPAGFHSQQRLGIRAGRQMPAGFPNASGRMTPADLFLARSLSAPEEPRPFGSSNSCKFCDFLSDAEHSPPEFLRCPEGVHFGFWPKALGFRNKTLWGPELGSHKTREQSSKAYDGTFCHAPPVPLAFSTRSYRPHMETLISFRLLVPFLFFSGLEVGPTHDPRIRSRPAFACRLDEYVGVLASRSSKGTCRPVCVIVHSRT